MSSSQSMFLEFPTGKIPKGEFCECCARYNNRYITSTVIAWRDNKVLLIHRDHDPMKGSWGLPGGYIDWDETVTVSAQRELYEETGLSAKKLELVAVRSDKSAGDHRQNVDLFFLAREVTGSERTQAGEVKDVGWFSMTELPGKLAFGHGDIIYELLPYLTGKLPVWQVLVL